MCIVEYFPAGVDKDTDFVKEAIRQGAKSNGCGLGFAFKKNGKVYLHKGFLSNEVEALLAEIHSHALTKDDELLFHARIATSGGTRPEMTHPFVCSSNEEEVGMLKGYVDKPILVHNGVFYDWGTPKHSDTFRFAHILLSEPAAITLLKKDPKAFENATKTVLASNKIIVMFPGADETRMIGRYEEDQGCFFSNTGYKSYVRNVGGVEHRNQTFRGSGSESPINFQRRFDDADDWHRDGFEDCYDHSNGAGCFPSQGARVGQAVLSLDHKGIHPFELDQNFVHSGMFNSWPIIYSNVALVPNIFNYDMLVGRCNRNLANFKKGEAIHITSYDPFVGTAICKNIDDTKALVDYEYIKDLVVNCEFVPKAVWGPFLKDYKKINDLLFNLRVENGAEGKALYDSLDNLPLSKNKMKSIYKFVMDDALNFVGQAIFIKGNKEKYSLIDSPKTAKIALVNNVKTDALILWYAERQHLFPKEYRFSAAVLQAILKKKQPFFHEFGVGISVL